MPRLEHLAKLRYIEQILMETLRIWPTAPAFALRPLQDTVIAGNYAVGKRDTLMVLVPVLHRDPKVWGDDVEAFRPERFAPEAPRSCRRTPGSRSATASARASGGRSRCRKRNC